MLLQKKNSINDKKRISVDELISDREKFDKFVYTSFKNAHSEVIKRRADDNLKSIIESNLAIDIPVELTGSKIHAIIFRQIATPNFEIRRFLQLIDTSDEFEPLFGEHRNDKFFSINEYKRSWAKLLFFNGFGRAVSSLKIVDIPKAEGVNLSDIKTVWNQNLIDFHHQLFEKLPSAKDSNFMNISPWLNNHGKNAKNYYKPVLTWFLRDAILFENFTLGDIKELSFTRDIFLPAFLDLYYETGYKPLIINLLPTNIEEKEFWLCHPQESRHYIENNFLNYEY